MKVIFAADHAGFALKQVLVEFVRGLGHDVEDLGAHEMNEDDDYPAIVSSAAVTLSRMATAGDEVCAIVLGASGQGEAMVMNRHRGVRCAVYYGPAQGQQTDSSGSSLDIISSTRYHNNANALSIGARFVTAEDATDAVRHWLSAPFSEQERHIRRIGMF